MHPPAHRTRQYLFYAFICYFLLFATHRIVLKYQMNRRWESAGAAVLEQLNNPYHKQVNIFLSDDSKRLFDTDQFQIIPYFETPPTQNLPVILLHGTPGGASNLSSLGHSLAGLGRQAIWFDMPGFGELKEISLDFNNLSSESNSEYVFFFLDQLGIDRAHIVGWSNGGAVALHMADEHPDRVASITLLAAVGAQETEGSGSYFFEHAKYKLGDLVLNKLDVLIPHFGILGPSTEREAFMRNFDETDQRKLTRLMPTLETPTLILHGRNDFLIPDWGAEHHHKLMPTSTLIMTPHDHFMPMTEPRETAKHIEEFIARHDEPGVEPLRETIDLAPRHSAFGAMGAVFLEWVHFGPWFVHVLAVAGVSLVLRKLGVAWVVILVGTTELDIGVAWVGLVGAGFARVLLAQKQTSVRAWLGALASPGWMLGIGFILSQTLVRPIGISLGEFGWVLSTLLMAVVLHALPKIFSLRGRRSLHTQWCRLRHHEWWPTLALHGGALPTFIFQSIKHRNPLVFTCCNPGITPGGGVGSESKIESLKGLLASGDPSVLFGIAIPAGPSPDERAACTLELLKSEPKLGGFPTILKPDRGEQGMGVALCKNENDVRAFFEHIKDDALVQRYDEGPHELGVFWVRDPKPGSDLTGRIFSNGYKDTPTLTGNGKHTLSQLIHTHRRCRCQASLHEERFADRLDEVIGSGETITLTRAGNHAKGAIFRDAPELVTPEFERRIDKIANAFVAPNGGQFDFGRFDVRYKDADALGRGEGFAIIEVNGVTSEAVNIYDPDKSVFFAWRTLRAQWRLAYEIGARRRAQGATPMGIFELLSVSRKHLRQRSSY
ncbi:MAG: hypothetical protein COB69_07015 [Phycisphaera sp.]|nr:MAG: hypothetical protein COB69_07015 [Phycisphaera sp.]